MNIKLKILIGLFLLLYTVTVVYAEYPPEKWSSQSQEMLKSLIDDVQETLAHVAVAEDQQGQSLVQFHYAVDQDRHYKIDLGLILDMNAEKSAFKVLTVTPGSLGSAHGVLVSDKIVRVDGIPVTDKSEAAILEKLQRLSEGEKLDLTIKRNGRTEDKVIQVSGQVVPRIKLTIGGETTNTVEYTKTTQELLANLLLRIQVVTTAINEIEADATNGEILSYTVHIPSINKAAFGFELNVSNPDEGFKVLSVKANSQAEKAGIRSGDIVLAVDDFEVNGASAENILAGLRSLRLGDSISLVLKHNKEILHLTMPVGEKILPAVSLFVEPDANKASTQVSDLAPTSDPRIRSGYDRGADFNLFNTFNFVGPTAIKDPNSSELLRIQFMAAIEQQMLMRGYVKADNPDVFIKVSIDLKNATGAPTRRAFLKGGIWGECPRYGEGSRRSSTGSVRTICEYEEGMIRVDIMRAGSGYGLWSGTNFVRIAKDEIEKNLISQRSLLQPIVKDTYTMFENFPPGVP